CSEAAASWFTAADCHGLASPAFGTQGPSSKKFIGASKALQGTPLAESHRVGADRDSIMRGSSELPRVSHLFWMADADGLTERYSEKWLEYVGQCQQQQQELWLEALHKDDRQPAIDQWKRGTSRTQPFDIVGRLRRADGEYRLHLIAVSPALDAQGSPRGWFGCCTDIEAEPRHGAVTDPV